MFRSGQRGMRPWRGALGVVGVLGLVVGLAVPATGAVGGREVLPPMPAGVDEVVWQALFGQTPDAWAPGGSVVADSGFEVWRDSFPFFNYGPTLAPNNYLGYDSVPPVNMVATDVQRMFGSGVCTRIVKGRCQLSPVASMWLKGANGASDGGHCFGFAALVQQFFDGSLPRSPVTSSVTNSSVRLTTRVQQELAYWFSTQLAIDPALITSALKPPSELVDMLKTGLTPGELPYLLIMFFPKGGGHAVTPYALYDKGNGAYDIAVYDNNYPLRARAVHVDTVADTWEYLVTSRAGQGDLLASGDAESLRLGLLPVADLVGTQPCTFCQGASATATQVITAPLSDSPQGLQVRIVAPDGKPVPGVTTVPSLTPGSPWPRFEVPPTAVFVLEVDARQATDGAAFMAGAYVPSGSLMIPTLGVAKGDVARVLVDPKTVTMTLLRGDQSGIIIDAAADFAGADYGLNITDVVERDGSADDFTMAMNPVTGKAVIAGFSRVADLGILVKRVSPATGGALRQTDPEVKVGKGDIIVIDYGEWKGTNALTAWILRANGAKVPLTLVRPTS